MEQAYAAFEERLPVKSKLWTLSLSALLLLVGEAHASSTTYSFSSTVEEGGALTGFPSSGGSLVLPPEFGDPNASPAYSNHTGQVRGQFTLTEVPDSDPTPLSGRYQGAVAEFSVQIGGLTMVYDPSKASASSLVVVYPSSTGEASVIIEAQATGVLSGSPASQYTVTFALVTPASFSLLDDSIPDLPALPTTWTFFVNASETSGGLLTEVERDYLVPAANLVSAPEPCSALLAALGVLAAISLRRSH